MSICLFVLTGDNVVTCEHAAGNKPYRAVTVKKGITGLISIFMLQPFNENNQL